MLAISSWVMSDTDKISYFVPTARCMLAATDVGYLKVPTLGIPPRFPGWFARKVHDDLTT